MAQKKGMMTVTGLIKALVNDITNNKEYSNLRTAEVQKYLLASQLELIRPESVRPDRYQVKKLKKEIINARTDVILNNIAKQVPVMRRISAILKKAKASGRVRLDLTSEVDALIYVFDFLASALTRQEDNLIILNARQINALQKNDDRLFLDLYNQQQKIVEPFEDLKKELCALNIFAKMNVEGRPSLFRKFIIKGVLYIILMSFLSFGVYTAAEYITGMAAVKKVIQKYEDTDLLYESETEKELEQNYGFNITGEFTQEELEYLKGYLEKYHTPEEIKAYELKNVTMAAGDYKTFLKMEGMYIEARSIYSTVRNIIICKSQLCFLKTAAHEIAHARHYWLNRNNSDFEAKWKGLAGKYNQVIKDEMGYAYAHRVNAYSEPHFGYAEPYGGVNAYEDVATMTAEIQCGQPFPFARITEDLDVYEKKIKLLLDYGFIKSEGAQKFLEQVTIARAKLGLLGELNLSSPGTPANEKKIVAAVVNYLQSKEHKKCMDLIETIKAKMYVTEEMQDVVNYLAGLNELYVWGIDADTYLSMAAKSNDRDLAKKAQENLDFLQSKVRFSQNELPAKIVKIYGQQVSLPKIESKYYAAAETVSKLKLYPTGDERNKAIIIKTIISLVREKEYKKCYDMMRALRIEKVFVNEGITTDLSEYLEALIYLQAGLDGIDPNGKEFAKVYFSNILVYTDNPDLAQKAKECVEFIDGKRASLPELPKVIQELLNK